MRPLLLASIVGPLAVVTACSSHSSRADATGDGGPPTFGCLDLTSLPVCSTGGWCWADPLPQGLEIRSVHGLASNDVWIAAGSILHWDGTDLRPVYSDPGTLFLSVFETAPGVVWAVGNTTGDGATPGGGIIRLTNGTPQTMRSTPEALVTGTGPDDLWFAQGATATHWDGSAFTDYPVPGSLRPVSLSTAGGLAWLASTINSEPEQSNELFAFAAGAWTDTRDNEVNGVHAFDPADVWYAAQNAIAAVGSSTTLASDQITDNLTGIDGVSPTDAWVIGAYDITGTPSLLHSDGTALMRVTYPGATFPASLFIGGADWGFIGEQGGALLQRSGSSFTFATRPPVPTVITPSMWGTGPNDVYLVGQWAGQTGAIAHWDGCRWSVLDPGVGPLGPLAAVWASGSEVFIAGQDAGVGGNGFVLHEDSTGTWTRLATPQNGSYGSVWGAATDDVWFAGPTFMHWDGTALSTVPAPAGLPPWPTLTSLSGSASDDIWAVEPGTPGTLYHYDGQAWTEQSTPTPAGFDIILSIGKSDVWAFGYDGLDHFDGTTWTPFAGPSSVFSMWANASNDVWFGEGLHWDGTAMQPVSALAIDGGVAMWGDGTHVWVYEDGGYYGGAGIHVH